MVAKDVVFEEQELVSHLDRCHCSFMKVVVIDEVGLGLIELLVVHIWALFSMNVFKNGQNVAKYFIFQSKKENIKLVILEKEQQDSLYLVQDLIRIGSSGIYTEIDPHELFHAI